jgi:8-oxo-dGTP pyrophosphatase MutT (NUDIX family)
LSTDDEIILPAMENRQDLLRQINEYIGRFPAEAERVEPIKDFVRRFDGRDLYDRKNFAGHLTASAFVIHATSDKLLLLQHKFLKRWLQPGGHIDVTDHAIIESARREVQEETGISASALELIDEAVFDFDSHKIPANPKKHELEHYHHDVRYLFKLSHDAAINIADDESTDFRWVPFTELKNSVDFANVVEKVRGIIN